MEDRWLSVDEIAAYLGIKRDTVYKWIGDKNMPAHRVGRLWKFRKEEVDEWVKAGGAALNPTEKGNQDSEMISQRWIECEQEKAKPKIYAVDLFCGVGGLTNGLEKAGIDVRLGVDIDPACEFPFTANNKAKFLLKSIEKLGADDLTEYFPEKGIRLLAGCAPCQTFSTYNQKANPTDKRWWLLDEFSRLVHSINPELVTMENVPKLQKQIVFKNFVARP